MIMRAVVAKGFGAPDGVLQWAPAFPRPVREKGKGQLLVQVHACSLSPGDWRFLSGDTDLIKKPPGGTWGDGVVPGLDVCGTVVESDEGSSFPAGSHIVGTWDLFGMGGMAEYAIVNEDRAAIKPESIPCVHGAALANSASHAMLALRKLIVSRGGRKAHPALAGTRILVIGGSGGVGTVLLQMVRDAGATFVAAVSTDAPLVKSLGADRVVNYKEQDWWSLPEFKADPFDVIFDCAVGVEAWKHAQSSGVLKNASNGGRFVGFLGNGWDMHIHKWWQIFGIMSPLLGRPLWSRCIPGPRWVSALGSATGATTAEVLAKVAAKEFKVVLDPCTPLSFSEAGVKEAFNVLKSRRAKGKVVVSMLQQS